MVKANVRYSLALVIAGAVSSPLVAQARAPYTAPASDIAAVRQAVLDYVEALYLVDPSRIDRSVSRGLAKIGIGPESEPTNVLTVGRMTFRALRETAAEWNEDREVPPDAVKEVIIFEVLDYTASVKLIADCGVDYLHLAKYDDRWLIVNVIYQRHPGER